MKPDLDKLLLPHSPNAVIATESQGQVLCWSSGAEAVFGYHSDEAVGRSLSEIIVPLEQREEARRNLDEVIKSGSSI
jgi:PAS domain S-box-containing protein